MLGLLFLCGKGNGMGQVEIISLGIWSTLILIFLIVLVILWALLQKNDEEKELSDKEQERYLKEKEKKYGRK